MIYRIKCHVCGRRFEHETHFMSVGHVDADGALIVTCNLENPDTHAPDEVRASYHAMIGG